MNTYSSLLSYLKKSQLANGSFENSPFQTSLILICLRYIKHNHTVQVIARHAINYLFSQASLRGTWNYWDRSEPLAQSLPDDLDDTAMALAAIHIHEPELINESILLSLVTILITNETHEGGPYTTWIIPSQYHESWYEVDPVVNASIGFTLFLQNIHLETLELFHHQVLTQHAPVSKYYKPLHYYYFLSRWYRNDHDTIMKKLVATYPQITTPLDRALFISTYLNLGGSYKKVHHDIERLARISPKHLTPDPFYIEQIEHHEPRHAQSSVLTAAHIIEALSFPNKNPTEKTTTKMIDNLIRKIHHQFHASPKIIRDHLRASLEKIKLHAKASEIFLLPYLWHQSLRPHYQKYFNECSVLDLCIGNTLGWIGFGIYDAIIDGEPKQALLPLANLCVRKSQHIFQQELLLLDILDHANAREKAVFTTSCIDGILTIPKQLPTYGDMHLLAHKSFGHAIGPIILSGNKKHIVREFFTHYLIARQLNDDAHDWFTDLQAGLMNPAGLLVIKKYKQTHPHAVTISLETEKNLLHSLFWYEVLDELVNLIEYHLRQARTILQRSHLLRDRSITHLLLDPLEQSVKQALRERDQAIVFIEKYR